MTSLLPPMSKKELDRFEILSRLQRKEMNGTDAARLLTISVRQVRRLKKRAKRGINGLIHTLRGKPSNRKLPTEERKIIVALLKEKYPDFKPTFASEKLSELHNINHDPKTIRAIQIEEGLWKPRRTKTRDTHRAWRQ